VPREGGFLNFFVYVLKINKQAYMLYCLINKKGLGDLNCLMKFWENFQPEILNQKVCRMLLSVHKKCSRLAVQGELGRYPVLLPALKLCIKYQYQLNQSDQKSLVYKAVNEMKDNPQLDSWYTRVDKIKTMLKIPLLYGKPDKVGFVIDKIIKGKFDRFFLDEINIIKIGSDGLDHNKLRIYKTLKGSFKQEPYITNIKNRNQREWLSRYRISAHTLRVETGRYTSPVTPMSQRVCVYCDSGECDTEQHAILVCETFNLKRQCFIGRMTALLPSFPSLSPEQQLKTILCPATTQLAKCASKYLGILSTIRKEIDSGLQPQALQLYVQHKI
jgi:hypothetical protein